jgi:hypothetical protein
VLFCKVGCTVCTKTSGFIKVNGINVYSWGTGSVDQTGNISINPGDVVQLQMVAIDNIGACLPTIPYSDVSAVIKVGGSGGTTIFGPVDAVSPGGGGSGEISYTFTASTCNYYFDLDSYCS